MIVRHVEDSDLQRLLVFLREHYPHSPGLASPEYLQWRHSAGPLQGSVCDGILAESAGEIIGYLGAMPDRIWDGGQWRDCRWFVNLMIAPANRGGLTVLRMFQLAMRDTSIAMTTGAGKHMRRLYQALGWQQRSIAKTYYSVIRPRGFLQLVADTGRCPAWLKRCMSAADWTSPLARRLANRGSKHVVHESEATVSAGIPVDVDELIQRVIPQLGCTSFRSLPYLCWKFDEAPGGAGTVFVVRDAHDGLRGYLVAKPMRRVGIASWIEIADYLVAPTDVATFQTLVSAAVQQALRCDCDFVRIRLSVAMHRQQLRRPLWWQGTLPVSDDVFLHSHDPVFRQQINSSWHLTSVVSDRCDYGRDGWTGEYSRIPSVLC